MNIIREIAFNKIKTIREPNLNGLKKNNLY